MHKLRRGFLNQTLTSHNSFSSPSFLYATECEALQRGLECSKTSSDDKTATQLHAKIIKFGYESYPSVIASLLSNYIHFGHNNVERIYYSGFDVFSMNLVIENLMKKGNCHIAKRVFTKMPVRDVVTWNSMIGGYVRNGRFVEGLKVFKMMLELSVEPDGYTFASVLRGCARLGAIGYARWVHDLMVDKRIELNSILSAALIDMYAKCGRIEVAKEVFDSVGQNDVSVWNAMINGLASHGHAFDAILVFSKMEVENVTPDVITFLGVLTACSHCGLVEQGREYFSLMRNHYSIQPQLEHFGAMVDLLGRAGLLEEAYGIIREMPMEPDLVIWRALLSACRTYRNLEFGQVAIANISHCKSGDYVLLSNMYCSLEKWDSAEGMRELMKKNRVHKNRGKSWIEIAGKVHRFKAGDQSHPETKAIYKVLECLTQRAKSEGFTHATELVLMDVSEEEKEANLSCHSEKLALAFGILKTSAGAEIMISKNLRICHDCHFWISTVSKTLRRVIVVRDRIRFHRFEGGTCSCGGYW